MKPSIENNLRSRQTSVDAVEPSIRFKEFGGAWEEAAFAELAPIRRGLTYTPTDCAKTGVRVLRSSNIDEDVFVLHEDDVFVKSSAVNIPFAKDGDILITAANGSSNLVGKHAIVQSATSGDFVPGGFMLLASTTEPWFLHSLMGSPWYREFVHRHMLGGNGALGNLGKATFDEARPFVPSLPERRRIAEFFRNLDETIAATNA